MVQWPAVQRAYPPQIHTESPSVFTTNAGYPLAVQEISAQEPARQSGLCIGSARLGKVWPSHLAQLQHQLARDANI